MCSVEKNSLFIKCAMSVCLGHRHTRTHTQLTHYRYSAGVAWAVCHMWRPAPAAGLALNTQPAAISLTHPVNPTPSICPLSLHL